jgi:hypothetical protein
MTTDNVEPIDDTVDDDTFQCAFETVLCRYGQVFESLAEYDRGGRPIFLG